MTTIQNIADILERFAPTSLAEEWDNVGLLVGDPSRSVERVMTCLTVTPATVAEAIGSKAGLVVSHHPLPFRPLKRLTTLDTPGRLLLELATGGVAVYSAHTAFDSAETGINSHLALGLRLHDIQPLAPAPDGHDPTVGVGRMGLVGESIPLVEMAGRVKSFLELSALRVVGADDQPVHRVAIACGSGGSMLDDAARHGCDCMLTGEVTFHTALEAEARGVALILPGHYASERFGMEALADFLGEQLPEIEVWASRTERDPLRSI